MQAFFKLLSCGSQQYNEIDSNKPNNARTEQERVDALNDLSTTQLAISLSENKPLIIRRHLNRYCRHSWVVQYQHEGGKDIAELTQLPIEERNEGADAFQCFQLNGKKKGSVSLVLKKLDSKKHVLQTFSVKIPVVE